MGFFTMSSRFDCDVHTYVCTYYNRQIRRSLSRGFSTRLTVSCESDPTGFRPEFPQTHKRCSAMMMMMMQPLHRPTYPACCISPHDRFEYFAPGDFVLNFGCNLGMPGFSVTRNHQIFVLYMAIVYRVTRDTGKARDDLVDASM